MAKPEAGMMVTSSVKLVRPLGEGGMGSVWLAEHQALHTQVVVKFIAAEFTKSAEALARFSREAAAASQVKSPHVVQTLDHGITADGLPYIVMELLEGRDLENHLAQVGKMSPTEVAEVVTQLSRALEKAHVVGIVHRDIKPANIFFCDAGDGALFVKLLDFGIAKGVNMPLLDSGTRTGTMIGSPYYMSPEQLVGAKDVDYRTDLWSVGVVAFEALTGKRAFDAETVGALAVKIHNEPLPLPSQVSSDLAGLDDWFSHACAKKPEERYGSAKEMADAFLAAASGRRTNTSLAPGSPASRRTPDPHVGSAKTLLDSRTDPRGLTDGGLGREAAPAAPSGKKGRVAWLGVAMLAGAVVASVGVLKLGKGGHAGPDPSAPGSAALAQTQAIASSLGATMGAGAGLGAANAATDAGQATPTGGGVGEGPAASSSTRAGGTALASSAGRPIPTHRPPPTNVPSAASTTPKRTDDIF